MKHINKFAIAAIVAAGLLLSACTVTAQDVINDAKLFCGFEPTLASIAALLISDPALGTADEAAHLICANIIAQASPPSGHLGARLGTTVTVRITVPSGKVVPITGTYTK
jgi:hypothetical protein